MEDWIRGIIDFATRPIRALVDAVAKRLSSVWSTVTGFFGRVRSGIVSVRSRLQGWVTAQVRHALAVLTTLRWVITTYVPRKIGDLARSITAWTLEHIRAALDLAMSLVDTLSRWAVATVNAVKSTIRDLATWALGKIGELTGLVARLLSHVFGPLATPQRLVAWILGPLVTALVGWALDNAVRLGRVFWGARARLTLTALDLIEGTIVRII